MWSLQLPQPGMSPSSLVVIEPHTSLPLSNHELRHGPQWQLRLGPSPWPPMPSLDTHNMLFFKLEFPVPSFFIRVISHSTLSTICSRCSYFSHFTDGDTEALHHQHPVGSRAGSNLGSHFQITIHPTPPHSGCSLPPRPTHPPLWTALLTNPTSACSMGAGIWVQLSLGTDVQVRDC